MHLKIKKINEYLLKLTNILKRIVDRFRKKVNYRGIFMTCLLNIDIRLQYRQPWRSLSMKKFNLDFKYRFIIYYYLPTLLPKIKMDKLQ